MKRYVCWSALTVNVPVTERYVCWSALTASVPVTATVQ